MGRPSLGRTIGTGNGLSSKEPGRGVYEAVVRDEHSHDELRLQLREVHACARRQSYDPVTSDCSIPSGKRENQPAW